MKIRQHNNRGQTKLNWLDGRHSFSFGSYYDPEWMGFGPLRVINHDVVKGGAGFGMHPHENMEIITYILHGELEHRDSLGSRAVIKPGDAQLMSAGTGIQHSEMNASQTQSVELLQMWIMPCANGLKPSYQQQPLNADALDGGLALIASPDGKDSSLIIQQDAHVYASQLDAGQSLTFTPTKTAWLQVARGNITINDEAITTGDGVAIEAIESLTIQANASSEFILFDFA